LSTRLSSKHIETCELELQFGMPVNTCGKLIKNNASREAVLK